MTLICCCWSIFSFSLFLHAHKLLAEQKLSSKLYLQSSNQNNESTYPSRNVSQFFIFHYHLIVACRKSISHIFESFTSSYFMFFLCAQNIQFPAIRQFMDDLENDMEDISREQVNWLICTIFFFVMMSQLYIIFRLLTTTLLLCIFTENANRHYQKEHEPVFRDVTEGL